MMDRVQRITAKALADAASKRATAHKVVLAPQEVNIPSAHVHNHVDVPEVHNHVDVPEVHNHVAVPEVNVAAPAVQLDHAAMASAIVAGLAPVLMKLAEGLASLADRLEGQEELMSQLLQTLSVERRVVVKVPNGAIKLEQEVAAAPVVKDRSVEIVHSVGSRSTATVKAS